MKLYCQHADTCYPDSWGGHHLPHIGVWVRPDMSIADLRRELHNELRLGAVMGSSDDAFFLQADYVTPGNEKRADALVRAAHAAIDRDVRLKKGASRRPFAGVPAPDDDEPGWIAYFVFTRD